MRSCLLEQRNDAGGSACPQRGFAPRACVACACMMRIESILLIRSKHGVTEDIERSILAIRACAHHAQVATHKLLLRNV